MTELTLINFKIASALFIRQISGTPIPDLFGSTDGKAVGTYIEQAFNHYLRSSYDYIPGNAASGIDFPNLNVDLKVTMHSSTPIIFSFSRCKSKSLWFGLSFASVYLRKI